MNITHGGSTLPGRPFSKVRTSSFLPFIASPMGCDLMSMPPMVTHSFVVMRHQHSEVSVSWRTFPALFFAISNAPSFQTNALIRHQGEGIPISSLPSSPTPPPWRSKDFWELDQKRAHRGLEAIKAFERILFSHGGSSCPSQWPLARPPPPIPFKYCPSPVQLPMRPLVVILVFRPPYLFPPIPSAPPSRRPTALVRLAPCAPVSRRRGCGITWVDPHPSLQRPSVSVSRAVPRCGSLRAPPGSQGAPCLYLGMQRRAMIPALCGAAASGGPPGHFPRTPTIPLIFHNIHDAHAPR